LRTQLAEVHVALPGRVVSYDSAKQSADVQPLIRQPFENEEGDRQVDSLPIVTHVPVVFPGAGPISMTWPIPAGTTGLLVFSEASLDKWLNEGGEVDPLDDRRHALTDGVFIPGLRPFSDPVPPAGVHGTAVVISAPLIHAAGTAQLALKSDVDALQSYIDAHFHTGGTLALGLTGPPTTPAPSASGTQKLKGS
jgi:hypothetical protein